jgi:hypothetical protein
MRDPAGRLAWIFARRLTRPFGALAHALGKCAEGIPQEGPRELREAGRMPPHPDNARGFAELMPKVESPAGITTAAAVSAV